MNQAIAIRTPLVDRCLECRGQREHDGLLVCGSCFTKITGIPWSEVVLDAHRTVCGFYAVGQHCSTCVELEQNSPIAEVGATHSGSPVAPSANLRGERDPKQTH